ncbi:MAG: tRNA 2-thiouridine(34) synthase MnmA [Acutalibacteraceae bacterium]
MSKKRVLVAMSGGVDSSAAAALLLDQGYEVEGATMQIWPDITDEEERLAKGCCSLSAVEDARRVAMHLGIKYHVLNFKDVFEKSVIDPFVREYLCGRTPNPCVECNRTVKFEAFLNRALALDFDYIATGHYGRISRDANGRYRLLRSVTAAKDQTYALYNLTQKALSHLLLPVGDMEKPQIRAYSEQRGIPVFDKPDSQEICFVKDNDYAAFIRTRGYADIPGDFVDVNGNVIGRHRGIYHYTIGQRKGLGTAFGKPMFVTKIDPETNTVTLGDDADTQSTELLAADLNWIAFDQPPAAFRCEAKIRYNGPASAATVYAEGDFVRVVFDSAVRAVTPGQSVVFYDGDCVIGGGKIIAGENGVSFQKANI